MSITLTHTQPAPVPTQAPDLEPSGLADLSEAPIAAEALGAVQPRGMSARITLFRLRQG